MTQALSNDNIIKLTAAETSREVKKQLKKAFPHMEKLSVTCKNFSLRIKWLNGPSLNAVKEVVSVFEGATLVQNGGDTIKGYKDFVEYQGKKIDFGIDYIFCERELSPANEDILAKYVEDTYGKENRYAFEKRVYDLKQELDAADIASLVWNPVETPAQVEEIPAVEVPLVESKPVVLQTETRYVSVTDTAKLVRKALKEHFPSIKFSVRSSSYSMGASIDIEWTDGPCSKAVDEVVDQFKGADFDGMQDLKVPRKSMLNGEPVRFMADYIHGQRHYSIEFLSAVAQAFVRDYQFTMPVIEVQSTGAYLPNAHYNQNDEEIWRLAWTVNADELKNLVIVIEGGHFAKSQKTIKKQDGVSSSQIEASPALTMSEEACNNLLDNMLHIDTLITQAEDLSENKSVQPSNVIDFKAKAQAKGKEIDDQVFDVLHQCRVENSVIYLPNIRLDRKLYEAVNEVLARLGGKWNKKAKGHVFETNPAGDFQQVLTTQCMPKKNPTAYFATPSNVAQDIFYDCNLDSIPLTAKRILEPSAGTGALAREVEAYCQAKGIKATIDCCEILPRNQQKLQEQGFFVVCDDFLKYQSVSKYCAIAMNPPFSVEGDALAYITHIEHAYSLLAAGGVLIAIAPSGFAFRDDKRTAQFRSFVEEHGTWRNLESKAFAESGTGVNTVVITLTK